MRENTWIGRIQRGLTPLICIAVSTVLSCGSEEIPSSPSAPVPVALRIASGNGQSAIAATAVTAPPTVIVSDSAGRPVPGISVTFQVARGGGWVVNGQSVTDARGHASTAWYVGTTATEAQLLEARAGALTVTFAASSLRPIAGMTVTGAHGYVEWIPGDMPIVVSAPHGGTLVPTEIPDRTTGTTTRDLNTDELAHEVVNAFVGRFGKRPYLIVCKLHRRKLDANREIVEAAAGNPVAERAWREYHGFIEASTADIRRGPGMGFYVDLHGHGHDIQRLELGYLVSATKLGLTDQHLALDLTMMSSALWPIASSSGVSFPSVLRGSNSLGAYLDAAGFPSVPSPTIPSPGNNPYFEGGYSTERHGTSTDRRFAGVQIEANLDGVRDTQASRSAFGTALVSALDSFLRAHGIPMAKAALRKQG
jgi:N-formylglutamate amidohydrolase